MSAEQREEMRRREETQQKMWAFMVQQDAKQAARRFRPTGLGSIRRYF